MAPVMLLGLLATLLVGVALGCALGVLWARARPTSAASPGDPALAPLHERLDQLARRSDGQVGEAAVVREGLERLHDQLRDLEHSRVAWQSQLHEQVRDVRRSTELLSQETRSLSTALRRPHVRGRWGELHLRRAVELAGLVDRCDFEEQVRLDDGALRPDLVVHLAGGRDVVVDAKVPLDAFLDATSAAEHDAAADHLARHARQVRTHVDQLAAKEYWAALPSSTDFVVLFVPSEACLAAALEADPSLLDHAATRRVVLASPSTLVALLRTVAQGWQHEALADRAREIHGLGVELHRRIGTLGKHLDGVGRSLNASVTAYNQAVGSWESRVLVAARRFSDLSVTDEELAPPREVRLRAVARRGDDEPGAGSPSVGAG